MAQLERAIGPFAATLLVIGSVIGSGIFLTTGDMAKALPSPALILLAWATGCAFALTGALTYAELGTMFPRAGGVYVFLNEAFGPLLGFLYGWTTLLVVLAGGIAAVAVGFAHSFNYFAPGAPVPLVAVASILALGVINYLGVRTGAGTNTVLTVAKVTGLLLLPIFALTSTATHMPQWTPIAPPELGSPIAAFGEALIAVLWACEGYYFLTYAGSEIREPSRTIPRALTLGLLAIGFIYLVANLVYLYALPMAELRGTTRVAEKAATALVGPGGATIIALTVLVSTLGANAAVILAGSRVMYAMAANGLFFRAAGAVHPRYRSPHVAVIALTAWSSILALSGTYNQLFTYVVFISVLFSMFGGIALFRLRQTRPSAERPYRVWGYPVIPALFIVGSLYLVVNTLLQRPVESLAGFGLLVVGLPVYFYWKGKGAPV